MNPQKELLWGLWMDLKDSKRPWGGGGEAAHPAIDSELALL